VRAQGFDNEIARLLERYQENEKTLIAMLTIVIAERDALRLAFRSLGEKQ
jgi:hypothetical protein